VNEVELDGLVLKITYDFLVNLQRNGLEPSSIRMKELSRDSSISANSFVNYPDVKTFFNRWKVILEDRKFLCSVGSFPIVQNINLDNKNLKFSNSYHWYDILDDRYLVKKIKFDSKRSPIYESEIQRYLDLTNKLMDQYKRDINKAISSRTELYVDPCYVDAGYISNTKN